MRAGTYVKILLKLAREGELVRAYCTQTEADAAEALARMGLVEVASDFPRIYRLSEKGRRLMEEVGQDVLEAAAHFGKLSTAFKVLEAAAEGPVTLARLQVRTGSIYTRRYLEKFVGLGLMRTVDVKFVGGMTARGYELTELGARALQGFRRLAELFG